MDQAGGSLLRARFAVAQTRRLLFGRLQRRPCRRQHAFCPLHHQRADVAPGDSTARWDAARTGLGRHALTAHPERSLCPAITASPSSATPAEATTAMAWTPS